MTSSSFKKSSKSSRNDLIYISQNEAELIDSICQLITEKAAERIGESHKFTIGVSGGSAAKFLCKGLIGKAIDWSKVHILFCDERLVASSDPDSTYGYYCSNLGNKVPIPAENIHGVDIALEPDQAASAYQQVVKQVVDGDPIPRFDLLVLGMGPDGHTASLFPHHRLLTEEKQLVASITDSPKPPPCRVTLTFPVINHARVVVFICTGQEKAENLKAIINLDNQDIPTARVKPTAGELYWFLDTGAASLL